MKLRILNVHIIQLRAFTSEIYHLKRVAERHYSPELKSPDTLVFFQNEKI